MQFDRLEWGVGGLLDGAVLGDIRVGMYGTGIPGIGTRGGVCREVVNIST